jgi:sugar phosphate isomerase/epimerase
VFSLGIVSDEIDRDAQRAFAIGTSLGIRRYELRFLLSGRVPDVDERELRATLTACERCESAITGISPGIFKYARSLSEARTDLRERWGRSAELAHRLGLHTIIVFGPAKPHAGDLDGPAHSSDDPPDWVLDALNELADAAAAAQLLVAIEPEPLSYTDTAAATAGLLARVDRAELRVNYDPGNIAWVQSNDPRDGVALLGDRIVNVHVKNLLDAPSDRAPRWSAADRGIIDYAWQFAELARIGYTGPISLEPHIDGDTATIDACRTAALLAMRRASLGST